MADSGYSIFYSAGSKENNKEIWVFVWRVLMDILYVCGYSYAWDSAVCCRKILNMKIFVAQFIEENDERFCLIAQFVGGICGTVVAR